jgi:hypothetical protein
MGPHSLTARMRIVMDYDEMTGGIHALNNFKRAKRQLYSSCIQKKT